MFTNFRVKSYNFFKRNGFLIYIIAIGIATIIIMNFIIGEKKKKEPPKTSYEPHNPIIEGKKIESKKEINLFESKINKYMKHCENREYEEAYNMLSEDCKNIRFNNNIENFKKYIKSIFKEGQKYYIQNYSNKDNIYIYQCTISEDILVTGNADAERYIEKIAILGNKEDSPISIGEFIKAEEINKVAEDEFMKIHLLKRNIYYDKIIYEIKIKNNSSYDIVLEREGEKDAIGIYVQNDLRVENLKEYETNEKYIEAGSEKNIKVEFPVYFDEKDKVNKIIFNKIRIIEDYSGIEENWAEELNNAIKKYSITLKL